MSDITGPNPELFDPRLPTNEEIVYKDLEVVERGRAFGHVIVASLTESSWASRSDTFRHLAVRPLQWPTDTDVDPVRSQVGAHVLADEVKGALDAAMDVFRPIDQSGFVTNYEAIADAIVEQPIKGFEDKKQFRDGVRETTDAAGIFLPRTTNVGDVLARAPRQLNGITTYMAAPHDPLQIQAYLATPEGRLIRMSDPVLRELSKDPTVRGGFFAPQGHSLREV